jgi:nucleotidyltransferase substrate binding protein (TIGR01987 family)
MNPEALLHDFEKAVDQFAAALEQKVDNDVFRAGCIQYFEFSFELSWKTVKVIAEQEGLNPGGSPKSCLKTAFAESWIDTEVIWLEMLEARNRMSHTYDSQEALKIYAHLPRFVAPMRVLLAALKAKVRG